MEKITLFDKTFRPFISNEELEKAIDKVAEKINADFSGVKEAPVLLCILNGSIMYTAELMKRLNFDCELISMKLSSYNGTESTGNVRQVMGTTFDQPVVDDFQGALGMLNERMRIANFMDSSRGAPTAGRLASQESAIPLSKFGMISALIGRIRRGATLTDADREALVRLSTQFGATPPTPAARGVPVSGRLAPILAGQGG